MSLKLSYFNARGLAEVSRLLLALAQVDYIDYRYPIEVIDPVNHIYKRDEFDLAKASGELDSSLGKLPVLEITSDDGKVTIIPQSKAIERYIAYTYGFMGTSLLASAKIDSICECIRDIKERYQKVRTGSDDAKALYFSSSASETDLALINELNALSKILTHEKHLSLSDVTIYHLISQFFDNKAARDIAGNIPKIRDTVIKVASRPEIRVWNQDRPQTLF